MLKETLGTQFDICGTLCRKNNGGVLGSAVSKYTNGITLNIVPLNSSTQTVSQVVTRGHQIVWVHPPTPSLVLCHL
jgi:hypothetical protein